MSQPQSKKVSLRGFAPIAFDLVFTHGLPSFPVNPENKKPLVKGGYQAATTDCDRLEAWAKKFPKAMCAIPTGEQSGFFVIDIDTKGGGFASIEALEKEHGRLPKGPTVKTAGGGVHRVFKWPKGLDLSGRVSDLGPGIDIRARGNYVVAPGSVRHDGRCYEWLTKDEFDRAPDAPKWLLLLCAVKKTRRERLAALSIDIEAEFLNRPIDTWMDRANELLKPKGPRCAPAELTDARKAAIDRWLEAGIADECRKVREAIPTTRNKTLNDAAITIWGLLKGASAEGLPTDDLVDRSHDRFLEAAAEMDPGDDGQTFGGQVALELWERTGRDADPRSLAHVGVVADPKDEFGDLATRAELTWPREIKLKNGDKKPDPNHIDNIERLLEYMNVGVRLNTFSGIEECDGLMCHNDELGDAALNKIWSTAHAYGLRTQFDSLARLVSVVAASRPYHPILDYLRSLTWDSEHRVDTWLSRYLGAADTELNISFGKTTLIGAVRRVLHPGCKHDTALVLEGPQGAGKSSALKILGGEWFGDNLKLGTESKQTIEATQGRWIVEVPELSGMDKREVEAVKAQLSTDIDRARLAYARRSTPWPRQFILIGTTNDDRYLKDRTGNRRFLPVSVGTIKLDDLKRDRDQLWAEAFVRAERGESAEIDPGLWAAAASAQSARVVLGPFDERLADLLEGLDGMIAKEDIWLALGYRSGAQREQRHANALTAAMQSLGWRPDRQRRDGIRTHCFSKAVPGQELYWRYWGNDEFKSRDDKTDEWPEILN